MDITLAPKLEKFIEQSVKGGYYSSADEVIREGLHLVMARSLLGQGLPVGQIVSRLSTGTAISSSDVIPTLLLSVSDAQQDLADARDEMRALLRAKAHLRQIQSHVTKDIAVNLGRLHSTQRKISNRLDIDPEFYTRPRKLPDVSTGRYVEVEGRLFAGKPEDLVDVDQLSSIIDDLESRLDGMNEMSEMTSLRLQMTMDRRSKFIEALSNIMKKVGATQDAMVQNLK